MSQHWNSIERVQSAVDEQVLHQYLLYFSEILNTPYTNPLHKDRIVDGSE